MELLQLKYFSRLAHNEHLTKTANEMYVTPSAVSTSIARLEDELGVKLFDRIGRNMKLNQYGKIYQVHIDQVLELLGQASQALESEKNKVRTNIIIALRAPVLWLSIFNDFRNLHKDYMVKQYTTDMEHHKHELDNFDIDFFIATEGSINDPKWDSQILFHDEIVLGMSVNHRLAKYDEVDLAETKDEFFIAPQSIISLKTYCDKLYEMAAFTPKYTFDCDESIRAHVVASSNDLTLTTLFSSLVFNAPNYVCKKISNLPTKLPFSLYWKKNTDMLMGARIFRDFLLSYDYEHIPRHIDTVTR